MRSTASRELGPSGGRPCCEGCHPGCRWKAARDEWARPRRVAAPVAGGGRRTTVFGRYGIEYDGVTALISPRSTRAQPADGRGMRQHVAHSPDSSGSRLQRRLPETARTHHARSTGPHLPWRTQAGDASHPGCPDSIGGPRRPDEIAAGQAVPEKKSRSVNRSESRPPRGRHGRSCQPTRRAASRIRSATTSGWEAMATWPATTSVTVAQLHAAMKRRASGFRAGPVIYLTPEATRCPIWRH